jgi:hypothetical protein
MNNIGSEITKQLLESSKRMAQLVASASFEFWKRKDFRLYVEFAKLPQTEQDRIFNELEVSVLGLFILQFEYARTVAKDEYKPVLWILQKELSTSFIMLYDELGVEKKFVKIWEKLIDLRLKEYNEDLKTAVKMSKDMKEFKGDDKLQMTWARIETIALDCLTHIRRGKVEEKDPLWGLIRKWLITLDVQLHPIIEMGKNAS